MLTVVKVCCLHIYSVRIKAQSSLWVSSFPHHSFSSIASAVLYSSFLRIRTSAVQLNKACLISPEDPYSPPAWDRYGRVTTSQSQWELLKHVPIFLKHTNVNPPHTHTKPVTVNPIKRLAFVSACISYPLSLVNFVPLSYIYYISLRTWELQVIQYLFPVCIFPKHWDDERHINLKLKCHTILLCYCYVEKYFETFVFNHLNHYTSIIYACTYVYSP